MWAGPLPPQSLGEDVFLVPCSVCGPWLVATPCRLCLWLHTALALCLPFFYKATLNLMTSCQDVQLHVQTLFPNKLTSELLNRHEFQGDPKALERLTIHLQPGKEFAIGFPN